MAGAGTAFGRGLALGVGAALLYVAARESASLARSRTQPSRESAPSGTPEEPSALIDWRFAEKVAIRASGQAPTLHPSARAQLQEEYRSLLEEIEEPIATYTGTRLSLSQTDVEAMDRPSWIRANMANFRDLLAPVEEFYQEQTTTRVAGGVMPPEVAQRAARLMLGSQLGLLVGYLSRRVLGQYDLSLLGREPITAGKLYFVEPNLRHVERSLGVPRDELRRWIALHEATHAHEFELHPWVREYMNTTLRSYLRLMVEDMRRQTGENVLIAWATRLTINLRSGHNVLMALMTPEQRELLSRLQALMSLAEGYSNHVMNAVGRTILPNFQLIHDRVEQRQRQRSQAEVLFLKLTGLAMKMEQYKRGEQFVDHVVRERDIQFVARAWAAPENLPTEREIGQPARWIARMETVAA